MSQLLWTPGSAGPQDELVRRIHGQIEAFQAKHAFESVGVTIELFDGSLHRLARLDPEPGFGFVTFCPVPDGDGPEEIIVPVGAIREIRMSRAEPEQSLGFSLPTA
jgi:hypothetical protein